MYEFTSSELETMINSLIEVSNDVACLDCWVDALEYDIKNYIGEQPFKTFNGFIRAIEQHLTKMKSICLSKEFILYL